MHIGMFGLRTAPGKLGHPPGLNRIGQEASGALKHLFHRVEDRYLLIRCHIPADCMACDETVLGWICAILSSPRLVFWHPRQIAVADGCTNTRIGASWPPSLRLSGSGESSGYR